jgi:hypothetical protein
VGGGGARASGVRRVGLAADGRWVVAVPVRRGHAGSAQRHAAAGGSEWGERGQRPGPWSSNWQICTRPSKETPNSTARQWNESANYLLRRESWGWCGGVACVACMAGLACCLIGSTGRKPLSRPGVLARRDRVPATTHCPSVAESARRAGEARPRSAPPGAVPAGSGAGMPGDPSPPGRTLASPPCWSGPCQGSAGGRSAQPTRSAAERPLLGARRHDTDQEAGGPDGHFMAYVRKSAQAVGERASRGPWVFLVSRTWMVSGQVATRLHHRPERPQAVGRLRFPTCPRHPHHIDHGGHLPWSWLRLVTSTVQLVTAYAAAAYAVSAPGSTCRDGFPWSSGRTGPESPVHRFHSGMLQVRHGVCSACMNTDHVPPKPSAVAAGS